VVVAGGGPTFSGGSHNVIGVDGSRLIVGLKVLDDATRVTTN
jgi:hypothetical protein